MFETSNGFPSVNMDMSALQVDVHVVRHRLNNRSDADLRPFYKRTNQGSSLCQGTGPLYPGGSGFERCSVNVAECVNVCVCVCVVIAMPDAQWLERSIGRRRREIKPKSASFTETG